MPSPENAQPLPRTAYQKQPIGCAPDIEEGELLPPNDDDSYQDPRVPPGVVDISEELRWRHRERQRLNEWARSVLARSGWPGASPMQTPDRRNEPPPRHAAREETTRNCMRKVHGPPSHARSNEMRLMERHASWFAPRPQRLPCSEYPSDGLAGPRKASTRHRGGGGRLSPPPKGETLHGFS